MERIQIVNELTQKLNDLADMDLVNTVIAYFESNATMPGEKNVKDMAATLKKDLDANESFGLSSEVRTDLIETFSSLAVKEVKLKNVSVVNATKKNRDMRCRKPYDLQMTLVDTQPTNTNSVRNTYAMDARVNDSYAVISDIGPDDFMASLPKGFLKNHPGVAGMSATIMATDHSNNKFANMSYTLIVNLAQKIAA